MLDVWSTTTFIDKNASMAHGFVDFIMCKFTESENISQIERVYNRIMNFCPENS